MSSNEEQNSHIATDGTDDKASKGASSAASHTPAPTKEVLHPEEVVTKILLIRHGDTRATESGLLYTDPAAELTEKGIAQAKAVARYIKKLEPDLVVCSAAKRVIDTASFIAQGLELQPILYEALTEWHVGDWEGRSYLDIKKNDPQMYKDWSADPIRNRPPGGESIEDLRERVRLHIDALTNKYAGKTIAFVTHAGIIRSFLVTTLGMPIDNFWRLSIPVGSVSRVDISESFATVQYVSVRPEL